ncbi:MAG TPA: ribosome biogenesis GTPase YlqF [Burkholderiales bacterium]
MSINWFPGHMVAASDKAKQALAEHDVVIEVLDARCPGASGNPAIERMRMGRQRPALKVLNKTDIADPAATAEWLKYFNGLKNTHAIAVSCKKPGEAAKVLSAARKLAPHRGGGADYTKPLRMLIMGVPNVGKSTLINALLKKRSAKVGDEPAVTKALARYDLGPGLWLTDTPGLMWPHIGNESDGLMLAASHIIGANAYFESEVAIYLADLLIARYPQAVGTRYKVAARLAAISASAAGTAAGASAPGATAGASALDATTATTATSAPEAAAALATPVAPAEASPSGATIAPATPGATAPAAASDGGLDGIALIETIARQRGLRGKGEGNYDFDRAAIALLADYRGGALGRITLETPQSRAAMLTAPKLKRANEEPEPEAAPDEAA